MNTQQLFGRCLGIATLMCGLIACQNSADNTVTDQDMMNRGATEQGVLLLDNAIQVLGPQGEPVQGARILIGTAPGNPFVGNEVVADEQGIFVIPPQWTTPQPITIEAVGYVRTSFTSREPTAQDFEVAFADSAQNLIIKGTPIDYPRIARDGKVDFALVIATIPRSDLINFDLAQVLSTDNDGISVLGFDLSIPSNLALPRQEESYFFSVELNKPTYRLPLKRPGTYRFMAAHGQFPIGPVFDEIREGASIFDVLNHLTFLRGGLKDVPVVSGTVTENLSVNQIAFTANSEIKAPVFPAGKLVFAFTAVESDGTLYPTDLKILNSNQRMRMKVPATGTVFKTAMLLNKAPATDYAVPDFTQMSLSLQAGTDTRAATFLPMIPAPRVEPNRIVATVPAATAGIRPVSTYFILSELETLTGGAVPLVKKTRLWELKSAGWVTSVNLPNFQLIRKPNRTYKWEVIFMGQDETFAASDELEDITHFTRNSVPF